MRFGEPFAAAPAEIVLTASEAIQLAEMLNALGWQARGIEPAVPLFDPSCLLTITVPPAERPALPKPEGGDSCL